LDWFEEIKAHGVAASLEALRDYDAGRAVPLEAFVYQRVIARVLTRHRQEWRYAVRVVPEGAANSVLTGSNPLRNGSTKHNAAVIIVARRVYEPLLDAVASLPKRSRLLIQQLFWQERTEREISQALRIGRRAVNKRKHAILRSLRATLEVSAETKKRGFEFQKPQVEALLFYVTSLGLITNQQER
jgi:DNA-directed RNA polymerase specialized sigma subunit